MLTVSLKNKDTLTKIQSLIVAMAKAQGAQLPVSIVEAKLGNLTGYRIVPVETGSGVARLGDRRQSADRGRLVGCVENPTGPRGRQPKFGRR